jgi:hypothetical protein
MMNLSPAVPRPARGQTVPTDPGDRWIKDGVVAVDAPPDRELDPLPEARWGEHEARSGIFGAVTPRVVALPDGGYRLYYTQILPRPGFPAGANDYDNATTRILSAKSSDGFSWIPEKGVRLSAGQGGAGEFRVVCGDIAPVINGNGRLRLYFECCPGPQSVPSVVRSALSEDGGLVWTVEPGERIGARGRNFCSPRITFLEDGRIRLYCAERNRGIISALSEDGGITFSEEPGTRIAQGGAYDKLIAFAPEVVRIDGGGYRMYYAGYGASNRAYILSALSPDGLNWRKEPEPVISPGGGRWDGAKCSEMCVLSLPGPDGGGPRYRMFYEACDGTAANERGVWRIAAASSGL